MKNPGVLLTALGLITLSVYLFVTAPPPLETEDGRGDAEEIPISTVIDTIAAENSVARSLYTKEIVGKGMGVGIAFSEFWRKEDVQAGPLPALYLRIAAASLQKSPVPLGLFLGSDYPIAPSNKFKGKQAEVFEKIKSTRGAEIFYSEDTKQYTAMYPDFSSVMACVTCHNKHKESPKTDWKLNDVMGATTWTYPKEKVGYSEYVEIVGAVREGLRTGYAEFLKEVEGWDKKPEIGQKWPRDGFFLPTLEVFLAEFERRASAATVRRITTARPSK